MQEIPLDAFNVGPDSSQSEPREGEVGAVSFSPDGLLLAVARSDDELHIYDSRFMGRSREPMRRFLHWGEDCCSVGDRWGIIDAVWVDGWCGRGLGVVTGGSDGERFDHMLISSLIAYIPVFVQRLCPFLGCTQVGGRYFERRGACAAKL